ncbi:OmpA family protein [Algoriphagus litoralis]|uniref:OmpA family protein n=1 Tax=Algoriphagus litoralis TaxID=2202829 RepID=UPI0013007037|nr:OmpA family protein [Algoriphagus litoralis]
MKKYLIVIIALALALPSSAQQYGYKWRFGFSGGFSNYFGDIRPLGVNNFRQFSLLFNRYKQYSNDLSFQLSAERALGNSVGLMFTAGSYQFGSSDRFVQNDGTLFTTGQNFDRALNFQANLYDAGLSLVFKPDNNWLLSGKSIIAPYLVLGFGVQTFNVFGDLLDENGARYDYTNLGTIPDGRFETNLSDLETELPGGYVRTSLYTHLGLGFRIRISNGVELFAQSDFKRASSDYLDDVAGQYRLTYDSDFQEYAAKPGTNVVDPANNNRGFDNRRPDWYLYHGVGIKFSIGPNKASFKTPVVVPRYTFVPDQLSQSQLAKADSIKNTQRQGNNYFTVIQLPSWEQNKLNAERVSLDSMTLANIETEKTYLKSSLDSIQSAISGNQSYLDQIYTNIRLAKSDTTVSEEFNTTRLTNLENERARIQGNLTGLSTIESDIISDLDSLDQIKMEGLVSLDTAAITRELMIYPGQVSKIIYSGNEATAVYLDSVSQNSYQARSSSESISRSEFEKEMERFRSDMLLAQAKRDSAMIMAFASKIPDSDQTASTASQEIEVNSESTLDDKTARKIEKNRKKQEKLEKKNNELLKDALLVGGTAATTAAISNSGEKSKELEQMKRDSLLMSQIQMDSIRIDSLEKALDNLNQPSAQLEPKPKFILLDHSKIEVYFGINETELNQKEKDKLEELIMYLKEYPATEIVLTGFADNTGSVSYNLEISKKRVLAVKDYLVTQGLNSDRIHTEAGGLISRGGAKGSEDGDRRVEIKKK